MNILFNIIEYSLNIHGKKSPACVRRLSRSLLYRPAGVASHLLLWRGARSGTTSRQEAHAVNTANRTTHALAPDVAVLNAFEPERVRGGGHDGEVTSGSSRSHSHRHGHSKSLATCFEGCQVPTPSRRGGGCGLGHGARARRRRETLRESKARKARAWPRLPVLQMAAERERETASCPSGGMRTS